MPHRAEDTFIGLWLRPAERDDLDVLVRLHQSDRSKLLRHLIVQARRQVAAALVTTEVTPATNGHVAQPTK